MNRPSIPIDALPVDVRERVRSSAIAAAASVGALGLAGDTKTERAIKRAQREAKHEERLAVLYAHLAARNIPRPVREVAFAAPAAGWCFDLAWPDRRVAVEIDGGAFVPGGGRHGRGAGFVEDLAKRNAALVLGWRVIHVAPSDVGTAGTAALIDLAFMAAAGAPLDSPTLLPASLLEARRSARLKRRKPPKAFTDARKGR